MSLARMSLGKVQISRLAIGGNPFSGFSHQGAARDREMRGYYTAARIKAALRKAEAAGITTLFARAVEPIRSHGLAAHTPAVHERVRGHLRPDFQLCCYYDPSPREASPHHVTSDDEVFDPAQRDVVVHRLRRTR